MTIGVHTQAPTATQGASVTTPSVTTQASGSALFLICCVNNAGFGTTPVQDSKSNTWTQLGTDLTIPSSPSSTMRVYQCLSATGGSGHTFTLNPAATAYPALLMVEVTNPAASPTVTQNRQSDTTSPYTSPTISPATATTLIGAIFTDAPSGTEVDTWGGSFASGDKIEEIGNANTSITGSMAANVQSAGGTFNSSVTVSGVTVTNSGVWIIAVQTASSGTNVNLTGQTITSSEGTVSRNVTLALSGQTATFSEGALSLNLGYSLNDGVPLTGQTATFAEGTPTETLSYALTGQIGTFSEGIPTGSVSYMLGAQTATFTEGTISASSGGNVTLSLSGQTANFSQGLLAAQIGPALTALTVTSSEGSLTPAPSYALSGLTGTFTQGTLTPQTSGDVTLSLTGLQAVFSAGTIWVSGADAGGDTHDPGLRKRKKRFDDSAQTQIIRESRLKPKRAKAPVMESVAEPKPIPPAMDSPEDEEMLATLMAADDSATTALVEEALTLLRTLQ